MDVKKTIGAAFCFFVLFVWLAVEAHAGAPTDQVKQSVDKVIDILKNKEMKRTDRVKERRTAIRKVVGERFDFEEMAKRSLAQHWSKRTPEEKKEFVSLYSDLLERTYIRRIENYTDEKVIYVDEHIDNEYAVVRTKMITKRNVEIPIEYKLLQNNGKWMVYDVIIEGVSLVNNYRTQFNKIVRSGSYEDLVKKLKNKQEDEVFEDKHQG